MKYIILNEEKKQVDGNFSVSPNDAAIGCTYNNNVCYNFYPGGGGGPPVTLNGGLNPTQPENSY